MEDSDQEPTTSPMPPANNGGVMDIQPPKPSPDTPSVAPVESVVTETSNPVEPAPVATPVEPVTAENQPVEPPAGITDTSSDKSMPEIGDSDAPVAPGADNPMAITNTPPAAKKKSGAPMVVIIVAVVIAVGLCALVITIFFKSKNDTKKTSTTKPTTSQVTADEVDQASAETDAALNQLDDAKDFSAADLTDQSLSL